MLTKQEVEKALPANLRSAATQQFTDKLNQIAADPDVAEQIRENFISYTSVLKEGKFKTQAYLDAVTYVSYKMMDLTNQEAWAKTFPARYQALVARGATDKEISSHVSAYNKGKLVNLILEQTLVPVHVLNQGLFQKALQTQAMLMVHAKSEKVQSDAANSILTHLAKPKEIAAKLELDVREDSGLKELKDMMTQLAKKQIESISSGVDTRTIAAQPLITKEKVEEAEFEDVKESEEEQTGNPE